MILAINIRSFKLTKTLFWVSLVCIFNSAVAQENKSALYSSMGVSIHKFGLDTINDQDYMLGIPRNVQVMPEISVGFGKENGLTFLFRQQITIQKKRGDLSNYHDINVSYHFWRLSAGANYCLIKTKRPFYVEAGYSFITTSVSSWAREEDITLENSRISCNASLYTGLLWSVFSCEKSSHIHSFSIAARYEFPIAPTTWYWGTTPLNFKPKVNFGGPSLAIYSAGWGFKKSD